MRETFGGASKVCCSILVPSSTAMRHQKFVVVASKTAVEQQKLASVASKTDTKEALSSDCSYRETDNVSSLQIHNMQWLPKIEKKVFLRNLMLF